MADSSFEPTLMLKLLKAAKQADPINFAFMLGDSKNGGTLAVDKRKTGEQLFAVLKKETKLNKGSWGTAAMDGQTVVFNAEVSLTALKPQLVIWSKVNRTGLAVNVIDSDKAVPEPVSEDAPEKEAPPKNGATGKTDADEGHEAEGGEEEEPTPEMYSERHVKDMIKRAHDHEVQFAFGLGKKPEENLLALHQRLPGTKLVKLIKQQNGATKGNFGLLTVEGQKAIFSCETKPLSGLKKQIVRLFKGWKLTQQVEIRGPGGDVEADVPVDAERLAALRKEQEALLPRLKEIFAAQPDLAPSIRADYMACTTALSEEELDYAADLIHHLTEVAETPVDGVDTALTKLRQDLAALLPQLKTLYDVIPDQAASIRDDYMACSAAIKAGDITGAANLLAHLTEVANGSLVTSDEDDEDDEDEDEVAEVQLTPEQVALEQEQDNALDALEARFAVIMQKLAQVMITVPSRRPDIEREAANFNAAIAARDPAAAEEHLGYLGEMTLMPQNAEAEIGRYMESLSTSFRIAHQEWLGTRSKTFEAIRSYQAALRDEFKDDPDFDDIDEAISNLDDILVELDDRLAGYLQEAIDEPDLQERLALKALALDALEDYQGFVENHPYLAAVDKNDFMPMTVYATLTASLANIEKTLA